MSPYRSPCAEKSAGKLPQRVPYCLIEERPGNCFQESARTTAPNLDQLRFRIEPATAT